MSSPTNWPKKQPPAGDPLLNHRLIGPSMVLPLGISPNLGMRISLIHLFIIYSLLFTLTYGGILRYDFVSAPIQRSYVKITKRVHEGMMVLEELDILYLQQVKARNEKSIKDKILLCAKFDINDPADSESIIGKIHCVLMEKFEFKKFEDSKEPSSGLRICNSCKKFLQNYVNNAHK